MVIQTIEPNNTNWYIILSKIYTIYKSEWPSSLAGKGGHTLLLLGGLRGFNPHQLPHTKIANCSGMDLLEKFREKCHAEITLLRVGRMHSAAARPLGSGAS